MAFKKEDLKMPLLDDIFSSEEEREDAKLSRIREIPIDKIDDFPNHPYKVKDDDDMNDLVESIKARGVIMPTIVRKKENDRYEMISGHRRKHASLIAGLDTIRCEVIDVTTEEAIIMMVESNFQRTNILPSEKAFSYKMRLEALNKQGKRNDLTLGPVGQKSSRKELADKVGDSERQIQRYIRLTYLTKELLDFVDEGRIKLRPAVEISYLDEDSQRDLVDEIDETQSTPSHAQSIKMRRFCEEGRLDANVIHSIMQEEKGNQKEKISIPKDRIKDLIPKDLNQSDIEDYVRKALVHYQKVLRNRDSRDSR